MALRVYKFTNIGDLEWFLRGGVAGGQLKMVPDTGPGLHGLIGETLTFTTPAGSVTFTGTDPGGFLTFGQIKSQIEAAVAGITVSMVDNRIRIVETTPTNGIDIGSAGAEPARAILGFDGAAGGHSVGKVIKPFVGHAAPTTPYLVELVHANNDSYIAVIME